MSEAIEPVPGETWEHYKGGIYVIEMLARMADGSGERCVVYRNVENEQVWVRTLKEWNETVPGPTAARQPRFERLE